MKRKISKGGNAKVNNSCGLCEKVLNYAQLEEERVKWQKVGMRAEDIAWIEEASKALEQEPIKLEFLEEALVEFPPVMGRSLLIRKY